MSKLYASVWLLEFWILLSSFAANSVPYSVSWPHLASTRVFQSLFAGEDLWPMNVTISSKRVYAQMAVHQFVLVLKPMRVLTRSLCSWHPPLAMSMFPYTC